MSTSVGGIYVNLGLDSGDFRRGLTSANRQAQNFSRQISSSFAGVAKSFGAGLLAGVSLRGAEELIDSATRIRNALKVAGLSGDELTKVYDRLFTSAQKNAVPIEAMATLYGRLAQSQDALGVSQQEMVKFVDGIGMALRVAGVDAQTASGALLQLSQALGSSVVRAEEFNSVNEGARPILQAVAAGLKEAGGSVAALRQLVLDGKVSSAAFFHAFEAGADTLRDKVAGAELTVSQQFVRLQNVLIDTAGKLNDATGASKGAGTVLERLSDIVQAVGDVAARAADGGLGKLVGKLNQVVGLLERFEPLSRGLSMITGDNIRAIGDLVGGGTEIDRITAKIQTLQRELGSTGMAGAVMGDKDALRAEIKRLESQRDALLTKSTTAAPTAATPSTPTTVSLDDYPVTGGKGKSTRQRADDYQRLTERIVDATAAQVAETEAQRQLNPLIEDYGYAAEKARTERELLTAAENAGKEITPALRAEIAALADQYATAGAEAARLAEEHGKMVQNMEFKKDLWLGVAQDFRAALADGKIEMQELGQIALNVFDKIVDKLLNDVIDAIFKVKNAGSGGSGGGFFDFLGSIIGGIFGGGATDPWAGLRLAGGGHVRGTGTGTSDSIPARLSNGEFVVNADATRKNRAFLEAINAGRMALPGFAQGGIASSLPIGEAGAELCFGRASA